LSDLHITGEIAREYYEEVIRQTNRLKPDLVVITGDLIDRRKCLSWLEPIFSALQTKLGVYYVLGNHDRRIKDEKLLRKHLKQAGMVAVNGKWHAIDTCGGKLWLAGNEMPWFHGAESLASRPAKFNERHDMAMLLSHSPDQAMWASKLKIPLMFAGHTHGGQIRIPGIGPVVSPSRYGVKYASGVFQVGATAMHVSRGLGGVHPLRWNCVPEVALVTLRSTQAAPHGGERIADSAAGLKTPEQISASRETSSAKASGAA
jgi:predicted MPP superfamily phosphohydrolase